MATTSLRLTRAQLSEFLKDHESVKQFEKLFSVVDETAESPDTNGTTAAATLALANSNAVMGQLLEAVQSLTALATEASAKASRALAELSRVESELDQRFRHSLEVAELHKEIYQPAPFPSGSIASQNADAVAIIGGVVNAQLKNNQTILLETTAALTDGAGAGAGTITTAPAAGNPTKWVPINDNGTTRYIPAW